MKVVNLVLPDITDADVEHLNTLNDFASLKLYGKNITQAELANLKEAASRARMNRDSRDSLVDEKAVVEIEELGGRVNSYYQELRPQSWLEKLFDDPGGADDPVSVLKVRRIDFNHFYSVEAWPKLTDAALEHLQGLTDLQYLWLRDTTITDAGLEHLKGLKSLQTLVFFDTKVTDEGVEKLQEALPNCRISIASEVIVTILKLGGSFNTDESGAVGVSVTLSNSRVTDAELKQLKGLTKLRHLDLTDTSITDVGLEHLAGLTELKVLDLAYTKVGDSGLEHLEGMTKLQRLDLRATKVTYEGVTKLHKALPSCKIWMHGGQPTFNY